MTRSRLLALALVTLTLSVGAHPNRAEVRATLVDGQVLFGDVKSTKLTLVSPLGELKIPLVDVGEVVPADPDLGTAGPVRVWLRDGSELVGRWKDPRIPMGMRVGKDTVKVGVPADRLVRLQTRGAEVWPRDAVYRVRTALGDDFLVDAKASKFTLANGLGEFTPSLADCVSVRPIDDPEGDWRVELKTGTVLVGPIKDREMTLTMTLGPDRVTVPLALFVTMEQQTWGGTRRRAVSRAPAGAGAPKAAPGYYDQERAYEDHAYEGERRAVTAPTQRQKEDAWFRNDSLKAAKGKR